MCFHSTSVLRGAVFRLFRVFLLDIFKMLTKGRKVSEAICYMSSVCTSFCRRGSKLQRKHRLFCGYLFQVRFIQHTLPPWAQVGPDEERPRPHSNSGAGRRRPPPLPWGPAECVQTHRKQVFGLLIHGPRARVCVIITPFMQWLI